MFETPEGNLYTLESIAPWVIKVNQSINNLSISEECQIQQYYDTHSPEWYSNDKERSVIPVLCQLKVNHIGSMSLWNQIYGEDFLITLVDKMYIKHPSRFVDELHELGMRKLANALRRRFKLFPSSHKLCNLG